MIFGCWQIEVPVGVDVFAVAEIDSRCSLVAVAVLASADKILVKNFAVVAAVVVAAVVVVVAMMNLSPDVVVVE